MSKNIFYLPPCFIRHRTLDTSYFLQYNKETGRFELLHHMFHIWLGLNRQYLEISVRYMEPP